MTPYISLKRRIIAWLLWHFEGYKSVDAAEFYILKYPENTRAASLMRDYWYMKKSKEVAE